MFDFTVTGAEVQALSFAYQRSPEQSAAEPTRHPVVVVGAGPVGLSLAIDLAQRGQRVLVLDNDHCLSSGSRAICFAKRTLEIWDRLGVGQAAVNKGVSWETGRVFFQDAPIYAFNLQTEPGHERPAFVNLQQYYAEAYLLQRALELPLIEIRWHNSVTAVTQNESFATLTVNTPEGDYRIEASYLAACDGGRSAVRKGLGLESKGRSFNDRFLIADVVFETGSAERVFPPERWFWFDPPFHPGQSVLLHRQPDGVWRIDFQLGWEADPALEQTEAKIRPRVDAMMQAALGRTVPFRIEWASVYSFVCLRMPSFVHGRVFFAGDSAHGVSPFGARGANSGVQDADNLAWKLAAVLSGQAPASLLASYGEEREFAADVNIAHSTRATDFITPKSPISKLFRDATLSLAKSHDFARRLINSGRLSTPTVMPESSLNTPDTAEFAGSQQLGMPALDAPLGETWLLKLLSTDFTLVTYENETEVKGLHCRHITAAEDQQGWFAKRYDAKPGSAYLFRPDQHLCGRWRAVDPVAIQAAKAKALGHP